MAEMQGEHPPEVVGLTDAPPESRDRIVGFGLLCEAPHTDGLTCGRGVWLSSVRHGGAVPPTTGQIGRVCQERVACPGASDLSRPVLWEGTCGCGRDPRRRSLDWTPLVPRHRGCPGAL